MLFKKSLLVLLLPLFSFVNSHKFYLSSTEVDYSEKDKTFQVVSRYFIDDFENMLKERYSIVPQLTSEKEMENIDSYFNQYLHDHFFIKINGERIKLTFIGKEYDNDVVKVYMESEKINIKSVRHIEIKNTTLFEMFDSQQNIVHVAINSISKSYNLYEGNEKAMLKF